MPRIGPGVLIRHVSPCSRSGVSMDGPGICQLQTGISKVRCFGGRVNPTSSQVCVSSGLLCPVRCSVVGSRCLTPTARGLPRIGLGLLTSHVYPYSRRFPREPANAEVQTTDTVGEFVADALGKSYETDDTRARQAEHR